MVWSAIVQRTSFDEDVRCFFDCPRIQLACQRRGGATGGASTVIQNAYALPQPVPDVDFVVDHGDSLTTFIGVLSADIH